MTSGRLLAGGADLTFATLLAPNSWWCEPLIEGSKIQGSKIQGFKIQGFTKILYLLVVL